VKKTAFFLTIATIVCTHPGSYQASARWSPDYANNPPEVQQWFRQQHNARGQWCCDKSDGHPFFGSYKLNEDGSVTLEDADGRTIPAYMVLHEARNPTGHAVWWYTEAGGNHVDYCFAPGTLG